ncbi:hypothetical protein EON77_03970 [bacterium]|nr:MAG: hypothetical protein EON77_03970 [bacterium]
MNSWSYPALGTYRLYAPRLCPQAYTRSTCAIASSASANSGAGWLSTSVIVQGVVPPRSASMIRATFSGRFQLMRTTSTAG